MDVEKKLLYIVIDLLLPLLIGYFLRRNRHLKDKFFDTMIHYNMLFFYPLLSVLSFWVLPLTWELIWLPVFGVLLCFIPGGAAYLLFGRKYADPLDMGSYIITAMLANLGTLGGLCAYIIYGETGFAYSQLIVVSQVFVIFLVCYPLARYYYRCSRGREQAAMSWQELVFTRNQLPVLGLLLGFLLCWLKVPRPALLGEFFDPLVHISAWTALIPVGHATDFSAIRRYLFSTLDLAPIRFIVTPLISYGVARLVFNDPVAINTVLILASTPTAISAVMTAKIHGLNVHIATASFFSTTVLFLLLIYPVIFFCLTVH
ncbi:MAG TPA: transporter [Patescibacteria group bacterium]|nr:transporter [Patescibacteria group bacterium]